MIKLLIYALLIYFGYHMLKAMGIPPFGKKRVRDPYEDDPGAGADAELIRDPQCQKYFMKSSGVSKVIDGETVHFCSPACRDAFLKARKRG